MPYIIKNGLTYTGNLIPITQVQYDALSEAEKNSGIAYFIVDSDAVLDASDVGLGEGNVEDLAGSVATIESSPATAIHAVGDYILWNGQLYSVIAPIRVGQDLTVGSNITATRAGSELTSLKSGLSNRDLEPWTTLVNGIKYSKEGSHVFIWFNIAVSLTATFTDLATLPAGYRPSQNEYFRVAGSSGSGDVTVLVGASGVISAKVDSGTGGAINGFICIA